MAWDSVRYVWGEQGWMSFRVIGVNQGGLGDVVKVGGEGGDGQAGMNP